MTPDPNAVGTRQPRAALNDQRILEAARTVFIADPQAPIAAVATHAGVGISALYRRYASKQELLQRLSSDGLRHYIDAAEAALADDDPDAGNVLTRFMHAIVDADTHALTQRLAGTFVPTDDLLRDAARAHELAVELFERLQAANAIRPDLVVDDLSFIFEQLAAVRADEPHRTIELRDRYLTLQLQAIQTRAPTAVPGPPPTWAEIAKRWET